MSWNKQHNAARALQDRKEDFARSHAADTKELRKANWEQNSTKLMANQELKRRMKKANQEEQKLLLVRRQRLAALLQMEHDEHTEEIQSSIETDDQRRERMIRDARRLQRERETRRKAEVAAIQEQQFRESLDDFRTRKSRAIKLECAQERLGQLEAKKLQSREEIEAAERMHKEYMKTADQMLARELREAEIAKAKNDEMVQTIAGQLSLKRQFISDEEQEEAIAVQEWKQRLKQLEVEEQRKEAAKTARRVKMDLEVEEQNQQRQGRYAAVAAEEKELDNRLLANALEKERRDKNRDAQIKAMKKDENRRFQAFLQQQMIREKEDSSTLNDILKHENVKSWEKKEAVWNQQAAARELLRQEVEKSRVVQLSVKDQAIADEEAAKKAEIARLAMLHRQGLADDLRKKTMRDEELTVYRRQLTAQVAMRENATQAERDAEVREKVALKAQFEAFDKKVEQVFQSDYKPPANYRRKKVEWYS